MVHRLIVVSNRLPISVREENGILSLSRSNGGLATALSSLFQEETSLWIGWTGLRRCLSKQELGSLNLPPHLIPINLTDPEITGYYDQFSNGIVWPLAHGLPATVKPTTRAWHIVESVMNYFADAIEQTIRPEDSIWIHDYHLALLPAELRRRGINNRIGFFLHTPFPSPDSFCKLPHAKEILTSLLSLDLLGLQVDRDVINFAAVQSKFSVQTPPTFRVKSFPIGIDFDSFDSLSNNSEVKKLAKTFKEQIGDRKVILSLSRLDYTKGITAQLHAFETLIRKIPDPSEVVYRLNVAPSRESVLEYRDLKDEIEDLVTRINTRFGTPTWTPIIYTYENIGLHGITALYQTANVHLNTPVADGMNLVTKEYIAARRAPGILVISSTMGAANQLRSAIIVPPDNIFATADALLEAMNMPPGEQAKRWKQLRHNVKAEQVSDWANDFLEALNNKSRP